MAYRDTMVTIDEGDNWWNLNDPTNQFPISAGGAVGIYFDHSAGNAHGVKPICDNPPAVQSDSGNFIYGVAPN